MFTTFVHADIYMLVSIQMITWNSSIQVYFSTAKSFCSYIFILNIEICPLYFSL